MRTNERIYKTETGPQIFESNLQLPKGKGFMSEVMVKNLQRKECSALVLSITFFFWRMQSLLYDFFSSLPKRKYLEKSFSVGEPGNIYIRIIWGTC